MPAELETEPPGPPRARPQSILFACTLNTVRSPMAEALARHHLGREIIRHAGKKAGCRTASPWRRWRRSASTSRATSEYLEELEDQGRYDRRPVAEAHHRALDSPDNGGRGHLLADARPTAAQGRARRCSTPIATRARASGGAHQSVRGSWWPVICWRDDFRDPGAGVAPS